MENQALLLQELQKILGSGKKTTKTNYIFHCPFCNHKKKKLEIDIQTDKKGCNKFSCWVCGVKGRTIRSLLIQLKISKDLQKRVLQYVSNTFYSSTEETVYTLKLPKEFLPIYNTSDNDLIAKKAKNYLIKRGVIKEDWIRYNIGICKSGDYKDRIIIPSYDSKNQLNYFIGRTFNQFENYPFKIPSVPKSEIIFFENLIDWRYPINLVEGAFDAITMRVNTIPLLSNRPSSYLLKKIITNRPPRVNILLDQDAISHAINTTKFLISYNIPVHLVHLDYKDPSEAGYKNCLEAIKNTTPSTELTLLSLKLYDKIRN